MNPDGLVWLLLVLGPFIVLQRSLHFEIQAVFLLITRNPDITQALFAILFFPGVLLHEASHYLAARLLGVRTGRFSLLPRSLGDGRLQLGYVETARTDIVRDSLIGLAPLLVGGLFVAYSGTQQLRLPLVWETAQLGSLPALQAVLAELYAQPDFWLWVYLTVAVSSMMMPSPSDQRAWLPLGLAVGGLLAASLLVGMGPWLLEHAAPLLNQALRASATIFGASLLVHLAFWPVFWALHRLLRRMTGLQVV